MIEIDVFGGSDDVMAPKAVPDEEELKKREEAWRRHVLQHELVVPQLVPVTPDR
jgi:hypothetical protein